MDTQAIQVAVVMEVEALPVVIPPAVILPAVVQQDTVLQAGAHPEVILHPDAVHPAEALPEVILHPDAIQTAGEAPVQGAVLPANKSGPSDNTDGPFLIFKYYKIMAKKNTTKKRTARQTGKTEAHNQAGQMDANNRNNGPGEPSYLENFFTDQLKDIYYAENKILEGLDKMIRATTTDELKDAFKEHRGQTEKHVKRLDKVFGLLNKKPEGKKCDAIEGILKEAESIISETQEGSMTRDAALIFAAQKVEHYEIATYGGLVQFAITLGIHEAADILDRTLREEENTDSILTEIAENDINLGAEQEGVEYSWEKKNQTSEMASAES